ncbi:putative transcription factor tau subunit sfc1 [Rosellinia necatrix]|uniref:Putative transcription factor tau subunit sfc1 n=1 Tax=Rosellinia necatrix TaxID=77044 RepID=A0A1W2TVQ0_ROSNE|nr:putative transcription factor tau subunit sfc1 [Rosellinia necatrix]
MSHLQGGQIYSRPQTRLHVTDTNAPRNAPVFEVPERKIVAIDHPCTLLNLEKGLRSFGPKPNFQKLVDDIQEPQALPLWFRPDNPASKPIVSHHAATNNILLKITVPKRTGRKRKRGGGEPFSGDLDILDATTAASRTSTVGSVGRLDCPRTILRKLQDNPDRYHVEAVGMVRDSHRYRGLADFQFANTNTPFLKNVAEHLLPLNFQKLRGFRLEEGVSTGLGLEVVPPPHFTDKVIGFNYNYEQNPGIIDQGLDDEGETRLVNRQGRNRFSYGHFIHHDAFPAPDRPTRMDGEAQKVPESLMQQLRDAMEKRPVWTRRAIVNQVRGNYTESVLKVALQLMGYQFRGGPFRDAIVKYGVDPRHDPKYRQYQTLSFKLAKNLVGSTKVPWQTIRRGQVKSYTKNDDPTSHIWDGESYSTDGKLWQICDITDPFMVDMIANASIRSDCDLSESGWFQRGTWQKIKAAMKAKMIAITKDRLGSESDDPPKKGYIYNSFLANRLALYPDESDKAFSVSLDALLRPLQDLESGRKRRRAPTLKDRTAVTATPDGPLGLEGGQEDESAPWFVNRNNDDVEAFSPDHDWEQMVGTDVEDEEAVGEED